MQINASRISKMANLKNKNNLYFFKIFLTARNYSEKFILIQISMNHIKL